MARTKANRRDWQVVNVDAALPLVNAGGRACFTKEEAEEVALDALRRGYAVRLADAPAKSEGR